MTNTTPPLISVCVCTYKRPHLLAKLLESLAVQTFALTSFEVVIADNDKTASAREAVLASNQRHPTLQVRYEVEPTQGISFARNRTVSMAQGELLAFIDDDEHAAPHWLADLVDCLRQHKADAVMGPVLPLFPEGTAHWVVQSRFFERPRFATGTPLPWKETRAGNALVMAKWIKQRQPHAFDLRLAWSGGEDTDFFKWLEKCGGHIVWCDSATVSEDVPVARQTMRFMLERSFRSSVAYWRPLYTQNSTFWRYRQAALGLTGGLILTALGLLKLPFGLAHAAQAWTKGMRAFGRVAALSKIQLVGYK